MLPAIRKQGGGSNREDGDSAPVEDREQQHAKPKQQQKREKVRAAPTACGTLGRMQASKKASSAKPKKSGGETTDPPSAVRSSTSMAVLSEDTQQQQKQQQQEEERPIMRAQSVQTLRDTTPATQHFSSTTLDPSEKQLLERCSKMKLSRSDRAGGAPAVKNPFATAFMSLKSLVQRRSNCQEYEKAFISSVYKQLKCCEPHLLSMKQTAPPIQLDLSQGMVDCATDQDFSIVISLLATHPTLVVLDVSENPKLGDDRATALLQLTSENNSILHVNTDGTPEMDPEIEETILDQCTHNRDRTNKKAKKERAQAQKEEDAKFAAEVKESSRNLRHREQKLRTAIDTDEFEKRRKLMAQEHMKLVKVLKAVAWRELREEHAEERTVACEREDSARESLFDLFLAARVKLCIHYETTMRRMWRVEEAEGLEVCIVWSYESRSHARKVEERRRKRLLNERIDLGRMEYDARKGYLTQEKSLRQTLLADEVDLREFVKQVIQHREEREHGEQRRRKTERDRQDKERLLRRERERADESRKQNERLRDKDRLQLKASHGQLAVEKEEATMFSLIGSLAKTLHPASQRLGEACHAEEKVTQYCRNAAPLLKITGPPVVYTYLDTKERAYPYNLQLSYQLPHGAENILTSLIDQCRAKRREALHATMRAKNTIVLDSPALQTFVEEKNIHLSELATDCLPSAPNFFERRLRILKVSLRASIKGRHKDHGDSPVEHKLLLDEAKLANSADSATAVEGAARWHWEVESRSLESIVLTTSTRGGEEGEEAAIALEDLQSVINCISFAACVESLQSVSPHYVLGVEFALTVTVPSLTHGSVGKRGLFLTRDPLHGEEELTTSFLLHVAVLPSPISSSLDADALNFSVNEPDYPIYRQNHHFSDILRTVALTPPLLPTTGRNGWVKLEETPTYKEDFIFKGYEVTATVIDAKPSDVLFLLLEPDLFTFSEDERGSLFVRGNPVEILSENTLTASHFTSFDIAPRATQAVNRHTVTIKTDAEQGLDTESMRRMIRCISFTCSGEPVDGLRTIEVQFKDVNGIISRSENTFEVQSLAEGSHFFSLPHRRRPFHNISAKEINSLASLWINANETKLPLLPDVRIKQVDRTQPGGLKDLLAQKKDESTVFGYVQILAHLPDSTEKNMMRSAVFKGGHWQQGTPVEVSRSNSDASGGQLLSENTSFRMDSTSMVRLSCVKQMTRNNAVAVTAPPALSGLQSATIVTQVGDEGGNDAIHTKTKRNEPRDILKYTSAVIRRANFEDFKLKVEGDSTHCVDISGYNLRMDQIADLLKGLSYHAKTTFNLVPTGTRNVEIIVEAYVEDPTASVKGVEAIPAPPSPRNEDDDDVSSIKSPGAPAELGSTQKTEAFSLNSAEESEGETNSVPDVYIRDLLPILVTDSLIALPLAEQRRSYTEGSPMTSFKPFLVDEWHPMLMNCFNGGYLKVVLVQGAGKEDELMLASNTKDKINGIKLTPLDMDTPVIAPPQRVVHLNPQSDSSPAAASLNQTAEGGDQSPGSPTTGSAQEADREANDASPPPPPALTAVEKVKLVASLIGLAGVPKKAKKLVKVSRQVMETALTSGSSVLLSPLSNRRGSKYMARDSVPLFTGYFPRPPHVTSRPNTGQRDRKKQQNTSASPTPVDGGLEQSPSTTLLASCPSKRSLSPSPALIEPISNPQPFTVEGPTPVVAVRGADRLKGAIRDHVRQTTSQFGKLMKRQRKAGKYLVRRTGDDSIIGMATVTTKEILISLTPFEEGANAVTLKDATNILNCIGYYCHPCAQLTHPLKYFRFTLCPADGTECQAMTILDMVKAEAAPRLMVLHPRRRVSQRSFLQVCGIGIPVAPYAQAIVYDVRGEAVDYAGLSLSFEISEDTKQEGDELVVLSREEQQRSKTLHDMWRQETLFLLSKDFSLETGGSSQAIVEDMLPKVVPYDSNTELLPTMQITRVPPGTAPRTKKPESKDELKLHIAFCYTDLGRTDFMRFQMLPAYENGPRNGPEAMTMVLNSVGIKLGLPNPGQSVLTGERKILVRLTDTTTNPDKPKLLSMQNVFIDVVESDVQHIPATNNPAADNDAPAAAATEIAAGKSVRRKSVKETTGNIVNRKLTELGVPLPLIEGSTFKPHKSACLQRGYLEIRIVAPKDPEAPPLVKRECLHFYSPPPPPMTHHHLELPRRMSIGSVVGFDDDEDMAGMFPPPDADAADLPPGFDAEEYLSLHPDFGQRLEMLANNSTVSDTNGQEQKEEGVRRARAQWASTHWLQEGHAEGRAYSRTELPFDFDPKVYLAKYPDLSVEAEGAGAGTDLSQWAKDHFLKVGIAEGRRYHNASSTQGNLLQPLVSPSPRRRSSIAWCDDNTPRNKSTTSDTPLGGASTHHKMGASSTSSSKTPTATKREGIYQIGDGLYMDGEYLAKVVVCYNFHIKLDFDWACVVNEKRIQRLLDALRYTAFTVPSAPTERNGTTTRSIEILLSDGCFPCNPTFIAVSVGIEKNIQPITQPQQTMMEFSVLNNSPEHYDFTGQQQS